MTIDSKQESNQNLVPSKTWYLYLLKKSLPICAVGVVFIIAVFVALNTILPKVIDKRNEKAEQLEGKSYKNQIAMLNEQILELEEQQEAQRQQIEEYTYEMETSVDQSVLDALEQAQHEAELSHEQLEEKRLEIAEIESSADNVRYDINQLTSYINDVVFTLNSTHSTTDTDFKLAIISLEDSNTLNYTSDVLRYGSDVGNNTFVLRGICDSHATFELFHQYLSSRTNIIEQVSTTSVESKTVITTDAAGNQVNKIIQVFQIVLTPKIIE